ncbi:hypothetical protein H8959_015453 [Pygathrix nigripes]
MSKYRSSETFSPAFKRRSRRTSRNSELKIKGKPGWSKINNWLNAAIECLEYFPDQLVVTVSQQLLQNRNEETRVKSQKILFDVIAKYYAQERDCQNEKRAEALEAIQLYLRLLLPNIREELRWLLTFMAWHNDNKTVVLKTLAKSVLQTKSLLKVWAEQLVWFLLEYHSELFKERNFSYTSSLKKACTFLIGEEVNILPVEDLRGYLKRHQENTGNMPPSPLRYKSLLIRKVAILMFSVNQWVREGECVVTRIRLEALLFVNSLHAKKIFGAKKTKKVGVEALSLMLSNPVSNDAT